MAAVVGTVSAVISLVQLTGQALVVGYGYLQAVHRAPTQVRTLLNEVSSIDALLGKLEQLAEDGKADGVLQSLLRAGIFDQCSRVIQKVVDCLETCKQVNGETAKNFVKKLRWPFKESETDELLQNLARLRSILSDAVTLDSAAAIKRIEERTVHVEEVAVKLEELVVSEFGQAERDRLMAWACPATIRPQDSLEAALKQRYQGLSRSFIHSKSFQAWSSGDLKCIWLRGLPGSGKTVLSATVIDTLQLQKAQSTALVYFFFDYNEPSKQSLRSMYAAFLRQLLRQYPLGIKHVAEAFERNNHDSDKNVAIAEYRQLFKSLFDYFDSIQVVIDALDESSEAEDVIEEFETLLYLQQSSKVCLLFTSRNQIAIERALEPVEPLTVSLEQYARYDVESYVSARLDQLRSTKKLRPKDPLLLEDIRRVITKEADSLFLQAKLHIDHISRQKNDRDIRRALDNMPNGLEATYELILSRITSEYNDYVETLKSMLYWILLSGTSVTPEFLVEATAFRQDDTYLDPGSLSNDPEDLVGMLSSLVLIEKIDRASSVNLAHHSIAEFLQSDKIKSSSVSHFHIDRQQGYRYLAETCIAYLSFTNFARPAWAGISPSQKVTGGGCTATQFLDQTINISQDGPVNLHGVYEDARVSKKLVERLQTYPLLAYAAKRWHKMVQRGNFTVSEFEEMLALKLEWFMNPRHNGDQFLSWQEVHVIACVEHDDCNFYRSPFECAVSLGVEHAARMLLPEAEKINSHFPGGWTPLTAAVRSGDAGTMRMLLRAGADVNLAASERRHNRFTALHLAAEQADEGLVSELLDAGASVHARTRSETTPFWRAVRGGSINVLKMLHEAGSDVNARTWDGWTPLREAAKYRTPEDVEIVKFLLDCGCDPTTRDARGKTPLAAARRVKNTNVVQVLQEHAEKHGYSSSLQSLPSEETNNAAAEQQQGQQAKNSNSMSTAEKRYARLALCEDSTAADGCEIQNDVGPLRSSNA